LVGHVAHTGESRGEYRVFWGNLREREHFEDLVVDRRVILKWILKNWYRAWTELFWLMMWTGGGLLLER
jgi:hypothetical protein